MKLIKLGLIVSVLLVTVSASAQNVFSSGGGGAMVYLKPMKSGPPPDLKRGSFVGVHILGDTISQLLNTFEKTYVYYKQSSGAYPVEEKVVLKTPLYKKVRSFNEFITKLHTEGSLPRNEAASRLTKALTIGIKLMNYETKQVEKDVKKLTDPVDFENYLNSLVFN